jgi:hypothetical protein
MQDFKDRMRLANFVLSHTAESNVLLEHWTQASPFAIPMSNYEQIVRHAVQ